MRPGSDGEFRHWPPTAATREPRVAAVTVQPAHTQAPFSHWKNLPELVPPHGPAQIRPQAPQLPLSMVRSVSQPFAGLPSQLPKPALQTMAHWPPAQVAVPLVDGQTLPQPPQLLGLDCTLTSQPSKGLPLQFEKPVLQTNPQVPPLQVGVEFGPTGHGVQDVPQVCGLELLTQIPPHEWVPPGQTQAPPAQIAPPGQVAPSSIIPSQSSSTPLQVSWRGCWFCTQTATPPWHRTVPAAQMPGSPVLQGAPTPKPSSAEPLQSLSRPSQTSADGVTSPAQGP